MRNMLEHPASVAGPGCLCQLRGQSDSCVLVVLLFGIATAV
nr:putative P7 protein [Cherry luteovirus A]